MNPAWYPLLLALAPGQARTGPELAALLGVSRTAVWKQISVLRQMGWPLTSRPGYALPWPLTPLDRDSIAGRCDLPVEIHPETASTNAVLMNRDSRGSVPRVVLAEYQSGGRGRRDRRWLSPPGAGLCLSLAWRFDAGLAGLDGLSLATGIAAAQAIETVTGRPVGLKWPNDLIDNERKLGGCLVEISGTADGPCHAVVGVGINVRMPHGFNPGQAWTDTWQLAGFDDRNTLAAALIEHLARAMRNIRDGDMEGIHRAWARHDILRDREVTVSIPHGECRTGRVRGLGARGGLLLETAGMNEEILMGEVSVRAATTAD